MNPPMSQFMFASGGENSNPTIGHGKVRRDQMEECGHYRHFRTDFALAAQLGVRFLRYATAFARRYPWIRLYTPVNEMYVCARFSALYGMWNEQLVSEHAYVTATRHLVKANVLAMHAILRERADALFIQSE
jgi:beta-glucosidase/6-phospho-beta-glucosidase/beta-galactosidase